MRKNAPGNQEDLLLVMAIRRGDQQALGRLYDKYAPAITGIISRIVYTDKLTDKILQKIFTHIWNEAALFDASRHSLFTWLLKITRQTAIDEARSAQSEIPAKTQSVYAYTNNKDDGTVLTTTVEMQMFHLLYYKGLTCTEVATYLQLPADEIKKQVRMAIKNLEHIKV